MYFFQTKFLKTSTFNVIKNYDAIDENQPVIIYQSFHFIRLFPTRFFTNQKKITENGKPWIENYNPGRESSRGQKLGIQDQGRHLSPEAPGRSSEFKNCWRQIEIFGRKLEFLISNIFCR